MDEEERQAELMASRQEFRWKDCGSIIDFWRRPDEIEMTHEINRLRKMSASYQRRHGWPDDGLAYSR